MTKQAGIAYAESGGAGVPVLFVHGWQADGSVWRDVVAGLGPDVRSIVVDLAGTGASSSLAGPYGLERFSADLRALLDSLATGPVVAVGHSMGAKVALQLAYDAPELVRALVLVAPVPAGAAGFSEAGRDYLRATAGNPGHARAWLAKTIHAPPNNATLDRLSDAAARAGAEAVLESLESWMHTDLAEAAQAIAVPTLVIAAEHDQPEKAKSRVADLIPGARYRVLSEAAHYCIIEKPAEVADAIREFIGSNNGDK